MVHHHHEQVFFRPYPDEGKPEQRTLRQIKRGRAYPAGLLMRAPRPLLSGKTREVEHRYVNLPLRLDDLLGQPFRIRMKNRAQRFVPRNQRLKTRTQRFKVQLPRKAQTPAQVISRAQRLQLP